MARKQKQIIWTKENIRKLEKATKEFNKRVQRLKQTRKDKRFLPSEISFIKTKQKIGTEAELNRIVEEYGKFKGKEAYKIVTLKGGKKLTRWEKNLLDKERKKALYNLRKELKKEEKPYYKMRFARIPKIKKCDRISKRLFKTQR